MHDNKKTVVIGDPAALGSIATRRSFLRALGVGGSVVLLPGVFAACRESTAPNADPEVAAGVPPLAVQLDLATDTGILNYAYALEQLEAGFYQAVVALPNFSTLFPAAEQEVLVDLRNHEVIHREFLRTALGGAAIAGLQVNFTSLLGSRDSILAAARTFEDLGVAAYNGAGQFLDSGAFLTLAGKIVSVEARHAAAIRDILDPTGRAFSDNTFETILDSNAIERAFLPAQVLSTVGATNLVRTPIRVTSQPTP
jgi:hypothetical protein